MQKIISSLLIVLIIQFAAIAQNLEGTWAGYSNLFPSSAGFIQMLFQQSENKLTGYFNAQGWNAAKRIITNLTRVDGNIHFEFASAAKDPFVCEGKMTDSTITGIIRRGAETGNFYFIKTGKAKSALDDYTGAYQLKPGKTVLITWGAFANIRVINLDEGSSGDALLPLSDDQFFLGRSIINRSQPNEIVKFKRNEHGAITSFALYKNDTLLLSAAKTNWYSQRQVSFYNGKVKLAGTLFKPKNEVPHAAVVFIHGSQDRGRDDNYLYGIADSYLKIGIAVLIYDKRGVGGSTGDWHYASFDNLADDALAGVKFLRKEPYINPSKIGLEAISQGGWIAPIAAAKDKRTAFMVLISPAGVSSAEQVTYDHMGRAKKAGATEEELKELEAFYKLQYRATLSQKDWELFQAAIPSVKNKKWFANSMGGLSRESWLWESTRLTSGFDPITMLPKIKCPVLLIFGEADPNYSAQKSAERMTKALSDGGNKEVTVKIFEGANHSILVQGKDGRWMPAPDPDNVKYNWLLRNADVDF